MKSLKAYYSEISAATRKEMQGWVERMRKLDENEAEQILRTRRDMERQFNQ